MVEVEEEGRRERGRAREKEIRREGGRVGGRGRERGDGGSTFVSRVSFSIPSFNFARL